MATMTEPPRLLWKPLLGWYVLEAALLVVALALYKSSGIPAPASRAGVAFVSATVCALAAAGVLLAERRAASHSRSFTFTTLLNFASVLLAAGALEIGARVAERAMPGFDGLFPRAFLPRDWAELAATNRALLDQAARGDAWGGSFLVHDDVLGWTVGPARSSHDGLYASSIEGLRSATPGESLAPLRARRRIAIVGDSYTFGMGVPFADTWGEALRRRLGDDFVVLNFGVDGYGVDQACLRYREDARAWKPDLVILGLIAHDVYRSTVVYPFISFPTWQFPFSKPRLVPGADGLRAVNLPLAAPRELFAVADISALPHVDLEPGYLASDWDRRWYHRSYSVRLATSLLPAWPAGHDDNAARDLNAAILAEFAADVRRAGGTPLVVYFPSYGTGEIGGRAGQRPARMVQVARSALAEAGLDYLDLTGCMAGLAAADGVAADGAHFSAAANDRIAGCLHDHLRELGLVLPATP